MSNVEVQMRVIRHPSPLPTRAKGEWCANMEEMGDIAEKSYQESLDHGA